MNIEQIKQVVQNEVVPHITGVYTINVFGSYANGNYDNESDVDFRVELDNHFQGSIINVIGSIIIQFEKIFDRKYKLKSEVIFGDKNKRFVPLDIENEVQIYAKN